MPELRWTLLIIGVLFVVVLAWWERRRPHQASRNSSHQAPHSQAPHISGESRPAVNDEASWGPDIAASNPRLGREPTLTLPEIRADVRTREPWAPPRELPVLEIPAGIEDELAAEEPMAEEPFAEEPFTQEPFAEEPFAEEPRDEESIVPIPESMSALEPQKAPELPPPSTIAEKPIVDWPPEEQRKLVSLRIVARPPERFRGSLVRQALAAEGFVLGEFDIFHKPDSDNRAVLSAASLTKPGTFDLETMDSQRFVGLNIFAVLPGPKSPHKTFEELLLTARMLNERLEGGLQDDRGGPLTPTRVQALRDAVGAEAKS
jgi:cell division protein ZipA